MSWEMEISLMDHVSVEVLEDDERTTACTGGLDKSYLLKEDDDTSIIDALKTKMDDAKAGSTDGCPTIHRVPDILRNLDPKAYEPKVISLGPYHHGKPNLKSLDGIKGKCLDSFLSQNPSVGLGDYVSKVEELKDQLRNAYSEAPSCEEKEFIVMMLLDACFVLEILLHGVPAACDNRWEITFVYMDMLRLENQIPFFLLKELLMLNCPEKINSLTAAIYTVFWDLMPGKIRIPSTNLDHYHHILHLLLSCAAPESAMAEQPQPVLAPEWEMKTHSLLTPESAKAELPQPVPALEWKVPTKTHDTPESAKANQPRRAPAPEWEMPIKAHSLLTPESAKAELPQPAPALEWKVPIKTHKLLTPESAKAHQPRLAPAPEWKVPIKTHELLMPESTKANQPRPAPAPEMEMPIKTHSLLTPESAKAEQPQPAPAPEWEIAKKTRSLLPPESSKAKQPQSAPRQLSRQRQSSPAEKKDKSPKPWEPTLEWIPCATSLDESGAVFKRKKKSEYKSFLDITFQGGTMEIPPLQIFRDIEPVFRNLIAFEQCFNAANRKRGCLHVTAYACLMDFIITTSKDVEKLDGIIVSTLGSDKEIARLFNRLCVEVPFESNSYLSGVYRSIDDYREQGWHKSMATLRHDYFKSPWALISVIAAILLFVLTITQTALSFVSYLHPI